MIAIADSGSSKIDWVLIDSGNIAARFQTPGINPAVMDPATLRLHLAEATGPMAPFEGRIDSLKFYGAGCLPELCGPVAGLLAEMFGIPAVEVQSDMLGVARALLGREAGIACILGTGSNSCLYNGSEIVDNIPPLGFILGDEGSGAVLGKLFVADLFKRLLPDSVTIEFLTRFNLDRAELTRRVYRSPAPNRFLASFAPFIKETIEVDEVRQIVTGAFRAFLRRNVKQYAAHAGLPLSFCGSIAHNFADQLHEAAEAEGCRITSVTASPMEGLIKYHCNE